MKRLFLYISTDEYDNAIDGLLEEVECKYPQQPDDTRYFVDTPQDLIRTLTNVRDYIYTYRSERNTINRIITNLKNNETGYQCFINCHNNLQFLYQHQGQLQYQLPLTLSTDEGNIFIPIDKTPEEMQNFLREQYCLLHNPLPHFLAVPQEELKKIKHNAPINEVIRLLDELKTKLEKMKS